jgi:hypothetical protein
LARYGVEIVQAVAAEMERMRDTDAWDEIRNPGGLFNSMCHYRNDAPASGSHTLPQPLGGLPAAAAPPNIREVPRIREAGGAS